MRRVPGWAMTSICPSCRTRGPLRLAPGQICASCQTQAAWQKLDAGTRLVIDRQTIAAAARLRSGGAEGRSRWERYALWAIPVATLAGAVASIWCTIDVLSPRPLGPIAALVSGMNAAVRAAAAVGVVALVLGAVAMVRLQFRRQRRRPAVMACHLLAILAGAAATASGASHWALWTPRLDGLQDRPVYTSLDMALHTERILGATVVVLAPDAVGDARRLTLGAGAVVFRDPHTAWIATCRHVAMPYAPVGATHDVRAAPDVWVQLADGREGPAAVHWAAPPPLDLALLRMTIDRPPEPVAIATDTSTLRAGAGVLFVPNPYHERWRVSHGEVVRRDPEHTPAGHHDLLVTDLRLIPDDSGGGLYNMRGQLVGLNTSITANHDREHGISVPSEALRALVIAIHDDARDGDGNREAVDAPQRR